MYFKRIWRVTRMSRMHKNMTRLYFPIVYKMLPNLAFSLVSTQPLWTTRTMLLCCKLLSSRPGGKAMWRKLEKERRRKKPKIYQTRPWLVKKRRRLYEHDAWLIKKLRVENSQFYCNYFRMEPAVYDELMQIVGPRIEKLDTNMRKAFRFSIECDPNVSNAVRLFRMQ